MTIYRLTHDATSATWNLSTARPLHPYATVADTADIPAPSITDAKTWAAGQLRSWGERPTYWAFTSTGAAPFWYAETESVNG